MSELYSRCTRAIQSKLCRVLADNDESRLADDDSGRAISLFFLRLLSPARKNATAPEIDDFTVDDSIFGAKCKEEDAVEAVEEEAGLQLSADLLRLLSRDQSSFGFVCHLFLEDNRTLDTLLANSNNSSNINNSEISLLLPSTTEPINPLSPSYRFHLLRLPSLQQPHAAPSVDRRLLAETLRGIGIVERANLAAGCVLHHEDVVAEISSTKHQLDEEEVNKEEEMEEGIDNTEEAANKEDDNDVADGVGDEAAYSNLVLLTAHQYGLDLVRMAVCVCVFPL